MLDVCDDRVADYHTGGAEGLLDLAVHLRLRVLHEDRRVGVALRHLFLALQRVWVNGYEYTRQKIKVDSLPSTIHP